MNAWSFYWWKTMELGANKSLWLFDAEWRSCSQLLDSEKPAKVQAFSTKSCENMGKPAIVQAF
ncbi:hypothetical protein BC351_15130 [Paenibacillus ferrarius]|uniref:Uncharacterized protein n=1 Tax=Paenibacillus ferrarius TaxID=1469647 RepID=A0A1V4HRJ0_9BACL|nr:hypothetical protein BC351_15130 [Paenibacillus ferrarius]